MEGAGTTEGGFSAARAMSGGRVRWQGVLVRITGQVLVLDAADIAAESAFWAMLLGGTVATQDDWHSVIVGGAVAMGVQLAPDHQAPPWPGGLAQQVHLDLYVQDIAAAHDHVTAAGARLLRAVDDAGPDGGFRVYADPAGHPFCLCWGPPPMGEVPVAPLCHSRAADAPAPAGGGAALEVVDPGGERAQEVVRAYMDDVASRYYQRPATPGEVDAALAADPVDDLAAPGGLLVIATGSDGVVLGCAGLRLLPDAIGEVVKVYVTASGRGRGLGARLVKEIERLAAVHGCASVRLDTRSDLVEARRLYARLGYIEVAPFNAGPYAEHWLAKDLTPGQGLPGAGSR